jgi:hypothetical protein
MGASLSGPASFNGARTTTMHLIDKHHGDLARNSALERPPFGPGFDSETVAKIESLEVWGSSFSDPGPDGCEFRAFDSTGALISRRTVGGY